jgi:hypothetical protein
VKGSIWRNRKNGFEYLVLDDNVIDATNDTPLDQTRKVEYVRIDQPQQKYVREISEFAIKFEQVTR